MSSLDEEFKEFEKETGATVGGSGFYKWQNGSNKMRILVQPKMVGYHWLNGKGHICYGIDGGCPYHGAGALKDVNGAETKVSPKGDTYILTPDGSIQIAELPAGVVTAIMALQKSDSWKFDTYPMPYSLDIMVTNGGTQQAKYQTLPNPPTALKPEVLEKLAKLKPITDHVTAKKNKEKGVSTGGDVQIGEGMPSLEEEGEIKPEDIPF